MKEKQMSRCIDADMLKKTLAAWIREHWTEAFTGDDAGSEFVDMIDHEETVDPVKIVHAHWKLAPEDTAYDNVWVCSNCGEDFIQHSKPKIRYCPNCGAKMDEAAE